MYLLTPRDNLSTFIKWIIIYHDLRSALFVLKSFIRIEEEIVSSLEVMEMYLANQNQIDVVVSNNSIFLKFNVNSFVGSAV